MEPDESLCVDEAAEEEEEDMEEDEEVGLLRNF